MITLYRMIRLFQLKVKWHLGLMQFLDKQLNEIIKNPEKFEQKFISYIADFIHQDNKNKPSE